MIIIKDTQYIYIRVLKWRSSDLRIAQNIFQISIIVFNKFVVAASRFYYRFYCLTFCKISCSKTGITLENSTALGTIGNHKTKTRRLTSRAQS